MGAGAGAFLQREHVCDDGSPGRREGLAQQAGDSQDHSGLGSGWTGEPQNIGS